MQRAVSVCPSVIEFIIMTPDTVGYRMPAEWERHASTWFTWPRRGGISFPDKYDTVPPVFAELIQHLVQVEEVNINVWHRYASGVQETLEDKVVLEGIYISDLHAVSHE